MNGDVLMMLKAAEAPMFGFYLIAAVILILFAVIMVVSEKKKKVVVDSEFAIKCVNSERLAVMRLLDKEMLGYMDDKSHTAEGIALRTFGMSLQSLFSDRGLPR